MTSAPTAMITVARAWHWGVAVLADASPETSLPEYVDGDGPVTASASAVIAHIRHAQDVDVDDGFASAIAVVRRWEGAMTPDPNGAHVVFDGVLDTPSGMFEVGDADEWVRLPAYAPRTRVTVSHADGEDPLSPDAVVFDLFPAGSFPAGS